MPHKSRLFSAKALVPVLTTVLTKIKHLAVTPLTGINANLATLRYAHNMHSRSSSHGSSHVSCTRVPGKSQQGVWSKCGVLDMLVPGMIPGIPEQHS